MCKEPSVRQTVKVKEGCNIFDGMIDAIGSKSKIERRLCEIEFQTTITAADDEAPVTSKPGKPTLDNRYTCIWACSWYGCLEATFVGNLALQ